METSKISRRHLEALVEVMGEFIEGVRGTLVPQIRPLVTIEQFFKGSGGQASLWFNLWPEPENIDEMEFWKGLRNKDTVWDVLISLTQLEFMNEPFDADTWVGSDHVVIITSSTPDEVLSWFPEHTEPEFISDEWAEEGEFSAKVFVPTGMKPLLFFYD
jgi:hypothetical protein